MGTAPLSCASLQALLADPQFKIIAAVTQPDRPKGRDLKLQPSPVKVLATAAAIPVLQPERAREPGFIEQLQQLQPQLVVVAAYGQILPSSILELPRFGCINVHTSLLPRYRGAAPIQWAIINGDSHTGVTIMKMDTGLDTGDILAQETTPIASADDAQSLHDRLATMGARLLVRTIPGFLDGTVVPRLQPKEGVVHAPKIKKEDGLLDWNQPAEVLWNRLRGLVPWPGLFTFVSLGQKRLMLKVWEARPEYQSSLSTFAGQVLAADSKGITVACGTGALRITVLQLEGGKRLTAEQFLAGHHLSPGQQL
jgi:methionyl-tRNA formyltransferase